MARGADGDGVVSDRSHLMLALLEAKKALDSARRLARSIDPELTTYISDLSADVASTMAEVARGKYAEQAVAS